MNLNSPQTPSGIDIEKALREADKRSNLTVRLLQGITRNYIGELIPVLQTNQQKYEKYSKKNDGEAISALFDKARRKYPDLFVSVADRDNLINANNNLIQNTLASKSEIIEATNKYFTALQSTSLTEQSLLNKHKNISTMIQNSLTSVEKIITQIEQTYIQHGIPESTVQHQDIQEYKEFLIETNYNLQKIFSARLINLKHQEEIRASVAQITPLVPKIIRLPNNTSQTKALTQNNQGDQDEQSTQSDEPKTDNSDTDTTDKKNTTDEQNTQRSDEKTSDPQSPSSVHSISTATQAIPGQQLAGSDRIVVNIPLPKQPPAHATNSKTSEQSTPSKAQVNNTQNNTSRRIPLPQRITPLNNQKKRKDRKTPPLSRADQSTSINANGKTVSGLVNHDTPAEKDPTPTPKGDTLPQAETKAETKTNIPDNSLDSILKSNRVSSCIF